ncbi:MAG TPA: hypothetical protein VFQ54_01230, partial [Thermomicrobiales bacterium]|nr:hypothetical protein [Thermomicrobiales bacterium]
MVSTTNQIVQLQREASPGVLLKTAMKQYMALKLMPAWAVNGDSDFKASGFKVNTAHIPGNVTGAWSVDGIQCYNAIGLAAACVLGYVPGTSTTTPEDATIAKKHVFSPLAKGADPLSTYSVQYGEATKEAIEAAYLVFNSLGISVESGNLGFTSAAISKEP